MSPTPAVTVFSRGSDLRHHGWGCASDRLWSQGVEDTFPAFAKFAAANHREYGLGRTPAQVRAKFFELAEQLEKKPIPTPDGPFDQVAFRMMNFAMLYGPTQLPLLADIWQAVDANQPAPHHAQPCPVIGVCGRGGPAHIRRRGQRPGRGRAHPACSADDPRGS
ncbi:hypothetical protein [Nocardioides sp. NPDC006273]|uniref:hypothetical protein n=1 Tax=Nocardioides sp. NPDC006273 TaxID=3155598 RepID=UPI0033A70423